MLYGSLDKNPNKNIFNYKKNNEWCSLTGNDIRIHIHKIINGLRKHSINEKDKVAILSSTSYKWALCDYGILCNGSTTVTVYPTLVEEQIKYILNNSESKLIFVENLEQYNKISNTINECPKLNTVVLMDDSYNGNNDNVVNLSDFSKHDSELNYDEILNSINENDLCTLIYTSGTTGTPKGVMLSHKNLISNMIAVSMMQKDIKNERFLSFLPLSHVLERMAGHFYAMSIESEIFYAENMETVGENMAEISPTVVVCVPRFFEKMHDKIIKGLEGASENKRKLFNWALQLGKNYTILKHAKQDISFAMNIKYKIADKLIYSKVRQKLGGNIKFFISGGAPLSRNIAEFFSGIGITILEGYGLTETSPVLTSNTPEDIRFGCVGKAVSNVKIKFASDGEILAKGPNVMVGYYKNEEATNEVIDKEGWFHTGDIGEIDADGFIKITDRKKSLIVTSAGKNIAPAPLENAILTSKYIDQVMVIGDKKNFISALIVPSFDSLNSYMKLNNKDSLSNDALVEHPLILDLIKTEIDETMKNFASYETVKKFVLLPRQFSIDKGEMTPKMSIVRKRVIQNYNESIDSIYN